MINLIQTIIKKFIFFLLKIYKYGISPLFCNKATCRFYPTCSEYCKLAIEKYGIIKGIKLSVKRLCKCRPNGGFGYDPIP